MSRSEAVRCVDSYDHVGCTAVRAHCLQYNHTTYSFSLTLRRIVLFN